MHIDWSTLALQTVNVLVLIWILGRFFFRPVSDLVAKRKEAAAKVLADAEAARKEAEGLRAEAAELRADINAQRDRLLGEAYKAADAEKAMLFAKLSSEAEKRREEATAVIERQRAAMMRDLLDHAGDLSVDIARRLLERLPPDAAFSAFLGGLGTALAKLTPDVRASLAACGPDHPIEVVAATPLSEEQTAKLRELVRSALGVEPVMRIISDGRLIAGFEIRNRHIVLRNNWQADLAEIRQELDR